jgi:hypothetical protein
VAVVVEAASATLATLSSSDFVDVEAPLLSTAMPVPVFPYESGVIFVGWDTATRDCSWAVSLASRDWVDSATAVAAEGGAEGSKAVARGPWDVDVGAVVVAVVVADWNILEVANAWPTSLL